MSENNINMSQAYEVLPPKSAKAYPIPCEEWKLLKGKIKRVSQVPFLFITVGSALIGASLSTFISILTGTFSTSERNTTIAWAIVAVTLISGALSLFYAYRQQKDSGVQANEIIAQMDLIEQRYEQVQ